MAQVRGIRGQVHVGSSPDEWQGSVVTNLTQADDANLQASDFNASSVSAIRRTNAEWGKQRDQVFGQFAQKLRNTEELSQQLSTRVVANRKCYEHTEWSLERLTKALKELTAPMELCQSRIAMRQNRPKREAIYDPFQEALLREEKELQATKARLSAAIEDTKRLMRDLKQATADLEADLQDKQHSYALDKVCVDKKAMESTTCKLDRCYERSGASGKSVLPELMGSPRTGGYGSNAESEGRGQERQRQKVTLRRIEAAMRLEAAHKQRWAASAELLDISQRTVQAAFKASQAEMGAKIEHTELLRQELVKQRRATEQQIKDTQSCFNMTQDKLNFLEQPVLANTQRAKIRGLKTPREATTDEVSEALHYQQHALHGRKMQLQSQASAMRNALEELEVSHKTLSDDVVHKERALAIDRGCASGKKIVHGHYSYGFAKVGQGQRHFSDTASSRMRQAPEK